MSSDSAHQKRSELIALRNSQDLTRPKRRTKSEWRRRERSRPKQRASPSERVRRSPSVDSGAGGEDEGSGSDGNLDKFDDRQGRKLRADSSEERFRRVSSDSQQIKPISSGGETFHTTVPTDGITSDITESRRGNSCNRQNSRQNITSDSAISTSIVSTSALSESPFLSSPTLSDQSKASSSSTKHRRSPQLSRALRRKQERIKRQLDLQETRAQLERQRFIEKAYHNNSNRMMLMTSSLHRRRQSSRSASSSKSAQRSRSPNTQSFPMGKESKRALSKSESSKTGKPSEKEDVQSSKSEKKQSAVNKELKPRSPRESSSTERQASGKRSPYNSILSDSKSPAPVTSASSPRLELPTRTKPENTFSESASKEQSEPSTSKDLPSSKPEMPEADSRLSGTSAKYGEEKTRHRSSRRDGSSRRKHHDRENKVEGHGKEDNTQVSLGVELSSEIAAKEGDFQTSQVLSLEVEDDFEKLAKRLENSPREPNPAQEVETRMTHAVDAIFRDGMPEMPSLEEITEKGLMDWRAVFRVEMMRLRREVNEFRVFCHQQIEAHVLALEKTWNNESKANGGKEIEIRRRDPPKVTEQLKDLETNMKLFQRKQVLLDQETELLEKEEQLAEKVKHMEEYEKEILEVESMLNQRQAICDRRQKALVNLDEELQALRQELEDTKDHINSDGSIPESNSERAKKNWDMVRRNLMDKQHLLETTVQKYRSELAAATSTIAGKDILISRLQSAAMHHEEEMASRDKRIQQLESKLAIALAETRNLTEQLSGSSQRDSISVFGRGDGEFYAQSAHRRPSQDTVADNNRVSFRSSSAYYRRPSSNAGSEQGDDYGSKAPNGTVGGESSRMNGSRMSRKRNSVSDNAISRLTLSTPRSDDKFGRGSSACTVQ